MDDVKKRITNYWSKRAEKFAEQRIREFESEKHELWLKEFEEYISTDKKLKVLDIGTGTGFFALLLASTGHYAAGIDLTEEMITEAKRISADMNIDADFYVMDAEEPDFDPESFDMIVSRNLTWTLPHLEKAYSSMHRLLKPGGVLINFDADYCREKKAEKLPENHAHKSLSEATMQEYENIKDILRDDQLARPNWDRELLTRAGFKNVEVDTGVWKRVYGTFDEFYNPTPIFKITAMA